MVIAPVAVAVFAVFDFAFFDFAVLVFSVVDFVEVFSDSDAVVSVVSESGSVIPALRLRAFSRRLASGDLSLSSMDKFRAPR